MAEHDRSDPYDPVDLTSGEARLQTCGQSDAAAPPFATAAVAYDEAVELNAGCSDTEGSSLKGDSNDMAGDSHGSQADAGRAASVHVPSWLQPASDQLATVSRLSPYYPWSDAFEAAQDMPSDTPRQSFEREKALLGLVCDFERLARRLAAILAAEHGLPADQRILPPTSGLGGIAGGYKVLCGNVFLKTSVDHAGIYGGDAHAGKAASHELKSLRSLLGVRVPGLYLPLMATARSAGITVVAIARLPIGDHTLVYGSCDAGNTVRIRDHAMNDMVRRVCRRLNLGAHPVGVTPFAAPPPKPQWLQSAPADAPIRSTVVLRAAGSGYEGDGGAGETYGRQEAAGGGSRAAGAGNAPGAGTAASAGTNAGGSEVTSYPAAESVRSAQELRSQPTESASLMASRDDTQEVQDKTRLHLHPARHPLQPRAMRVGQAGAERHYAGHTVLWGACDLEGHLVRTRAQQQPAGAEGQIKDSTADPVASGTAPIAAAYPSSSSDAAQDLARQQAASIESPSERRYLLDTARLFPAFRPRHRSSGEVVPAVSEALGPNSDQRALVIIPAYESHQVREFHPTNPDRSWYKEAVHILSRCIGTKLRYAEYIYRDLLHGQRYQTADGEQYQGPAAPISVGQLEDAMRRTPLREDNVRYTDSEDLVRIKRARRSPRGSGVMVQAIELDLSAEESPLVRQDAASLAPFSEASLNAWLCGSVASGAGQDWPEADRARWRCITEHWAGIDVLEGAVPRSSFGLSGGVPAMAHFPPGWHDVFDAPASQAVAAAEAAAVGLGRGVAGWHVGDRSNINTRASALLGVQVTGDVVLCLGVGQPLFKLLRPEAVLKHPKPLSSDAFSGFSQCRMCKTNACGHCSKVFNEEVQQAAMVVLRDRIRELARQLVDGSVSISDSDQLCSVLHSKGINLRYLGLLRASIRSLADKELAGSGQGNAFRVENGSRRGSLQAGLSAGTGIAGSDGARAAVSGASSQWIQSLLLQEMVARTLRVSLEERMRLAFRLHSAVRHRAGTDAREASDELDVASIVAASFLNVAFGSSRFTSRLWPQLLVALYYKYGVLALSPEEREPGNWIFDSSGLKPVPLLLRLVSLAGLEFDAAPRGADSGTLSETTAARASATVSVGESTAEVPGSTQYDWNRWNAAYDGPLCAILRNPEAMSLAAAPFTFSSISKDTARREDVPPALVCVRVVPRSKPMVHRDDMVRSIEELAVSESRSRAASVAEDGTSSAGHGGRELDRVRTLVYIVRLATDAFGQKDAYTLSAQVQLGSELTRRYRSAEGKAHVLAALQYMTPQNSSDGLQGAGDPEANSVSEDQGLPLHLTIAGIEARCALGEALELQGAFDEALETYRHALARVRLLAPLHPLVGKLSCCVGRVLLLHPSTTRGGSDSTSLGTSSIAAYTSEGFTGSIGSELEHGASAIAAVRAAFKVYDSLLAGSDSPSSIVQLLVPALLSGKVGDVAASISSTCQLVRGFVQRQAQALALMGVQDVKRAALGTAPMERSSGIKYIAKARSLDQPHGSDGGGARVVKLANGLKFGVPAGRPESTITMLPFYWHGEDDAELALKALLRRLGGPRALEEADKHAGELAGVKLASGLAAVASVPPPRTASSLPAAPDLAEMEQSLVPPAMGRSKSDELFDELQAGDVPRSDTDAAGAGSATGLVEHGSSSGDSAEQEACIRAIQAGRATLHRLVRSLALLEDMIGAPRGSNLGLSGRLFGSSGITGSADAFNEWVLGDELFTKPIPQRQSSVASWGDDASSRDILDSGEAISVSAAHASGLRLATDDASAVVEILGPIVKWAQAGDMACSLLRFASSTGDALESHQVNEVYLEGPTRVRCTLCATTHPGVLAAWYMPVRSGWYSLVASVRAPDGTLGEHVSSQDCLCVVPGLPDINSAAVFLPAKVYTHQILMGRVDCRDCCGNIRMNPLDQLHMVGVLSGRRMRTMCRIRADVGLDGMVASSPTARVQSIPKEMSISDMNLRVGIVNSAGEYQLDMRSATAPDGTFVDPPHWLVWRCFMPATTMTSGPWKFNCEHGSLLKSYEVCRVEVVDTPGTSSLCPHRVNDMFSCEGTLCYMCSMRWANTCTLCDSILVGRTTMARLCQNHAQQHGGSGFAKAHCIRCGGQCVMNTRVARLCSRCSVTKAAYCVWKGKH